VRAEGRGRQKSRLGGDGDPPQHTHTCASYFGGLRQDLGKTQLGQLVVEAVGGELRASSLEAENLSLSRLAPKMLGEKRKW
jgi:hypothetical protein